MRRGAGQAWRLESAADIYYLGQIQTRLKSAQTVRYGYDAICAHNLHSLYHIDKFPTDKRALFYDGKCVNVHKSPKKNVMMLVNIHMKNVNDNDVDFDANINRDMCMKVNVYIYRHKATYCR